MIELEETNATCLISVGDGSVRHRAADSGVVATIYCAQISEGALVNAVARAYTSFGVRRGTPSAGTAMHSVDNLGPCGGLDLLASIAVQMSMRDAVILSTARTPVGHPYGMSGAARSAMRAITATMNVSAAAQFEVL
jgi:hypothetical protein